MLDIITMFQPIYQKTFTELHLVGIKIMKTLVCQPEIINEFLLSVIPLPSSCNATIVTAYFKMRSKHSHEEYVSWMSNMLTLKDCMLIFTQPELVE